MKFKVYRVAGVLRPGSSNDPRMIHVTIQRHVVSEFTILQYCGEIDEEELRAAGLIKLINKLEQVGEVLLKSVDVPRIEAILPSCRGSRFLVLKR